MSTPVTSRLTESDLKAVAISRLHRTRRITSQAIIANEYRLADSGVRADLAILDKKFIGIEIKSDLDSLRRLASQVKAYDLYFDLTILLVAEKHIANIKFDLSRVELWSVSTSGKVKTISKPTRARPKFARERLVDLLPARTRRRVQAPKQGSILSDLATESFRKYFTDRFSITSMAFWRGSTASESGKCDLSSLSIYKPLRSRAVARANQRASVFKEWASKS